jgi:hypothetical protein
MGMKRFLKSALMAFVIAVPVHSDTVIVPPDRATQAGNNHLLDGFHNTGSFQSVYGAQNFSSTVLITGVAFRADENAGGLSLQASIPRVVINLSTYHGTFSSFNPSSYASNKGSDDTKVFDSAVTWTTTDLAGAQPNPFDLKIQFSTPFVYDPSKGSLLMSYSAPDQFGSSISADLHNNGDPSVGWVAGGFPFASIESTLVTEFNTQSVPEARPVLYICLGIFIMARRFTRR